MARARVYLRHSNRHIAQAMEDRVRGCLDAGGWFQPVAADRPFKTKDPVQFYGYRLSEEERVKIQGNLVALSWGDESVDRWVQLGGGLKQLRRIWFLDVVATSPGLVQAITQDLRDDLSGVIGAGTRPFLDLVDYANQAPLTGWQAELTDISVSMPETGVEAKRPWLTIGGFLELTLPEDGCYGVR